MLSPALLLQLTLRVLADNFSPLRAYAAMPLPFTLLMLL